MTQRIAFLQEEIATLRRTESLNIEWCQRLREELSSSRQAQVYLLCGYADSRHGLSEIYSYTGPVSSVFKSYGENHLINQLWTLCETRYCSTLKSVDLTVDPSVEAAMLQFITYIRQQGRQISADNVYHTPDTVIIQYYY